MNNSTCAINWNFSSTSLIVVATRHKTNACMKNSMLISKIWVANSQQHKMNTYLHRKTILKGIFNCQNTRDNVVPRMPLWSLDIPQWHITPHPQLSAKIIILYVFHTHRRIKSKFPNHINSIYLSDVYKEIIHHYSHVGFVLRHKRFCYRGGPEKVDFQHIDSKSFPSQHAHSPNVGLMSANVADVGLTIKQHWANFSLE